MNRKYSSEQDRCTGGQLTWRASSVQQRNAVSEACGVHVGRLNSAIIAQLDNVDDFKSRRRKAAASEVGLLSVQVLRGGSEASRMLVLLTYTSRMNCGPR